MEKTLLKVIVWLFFFGGLIGFGLALMKLFGGGTPAEYGILGIGGGFWLLSAAITVFIQDRVS